MPSDEKLIAKKLIANGEKILKTTVPLIRFTQDEDADRLLNNLNEYPHAFVLACVMDRQMKAELAWLIPHRFSQKIGNFKFSNLEKLPLSDIQRLMTKPEPLHRFPKEMSKNFYEAIRLIRDRYEGNAARIWADKPPSAEVVYEFLQFRGVGPKIATMAANILARDFKVPFGDYYSIDISVDIHVRRVFQRLGLVPKNASQDELIYKARSLCPEFPGLMDLPAWEIGRNWCKPGRPDCSECYMKELCRYNAAANKSLKQDAALLRRLA